MTARRLRAAVSGSAALSAVVAASFLMAVPVHATELRAPAPYTNCTTLNEKYPHGVGRANAKDRTSGTPVTTFKRSSKLYATAMSKNSGLDRDKDGVACEKR